MRKLQALKIGLLLSILLLFLTSPVGASDSQDSYEILLSRIDLPFTDRLLNEFYTPPARVAAVPESQLRPAASSSRLLLKEKDDLTAVNFNNNAFFSPYIGAGFGHEEPPIHDPAQPQILTLRLGAGFGCNLDALTRLFFDYTFQILPDPTPFSNPRLDEAHNISLGLQFNF